MPKRKAERIVLRLRSPLPVPLQKETYVLRLQKCPESRTVRLHLLDRCGGTVDTRVAPNGYVSFDGSSGDRSVQCQWLIRAREGERIKLHAVYESPRKGSRCHVYNGKRSDVLPVWSKTRSYSESVFLLSTSSTLLMRCFVPFRFARSTSVRVWYSVVKSTIYSPVT